MKKSISVPLSLGLLFLAACGEAPSQANLASQGATSNKASVSRDYTLTRAGQKMALLGTRPVTIETRRDSSNGARLQGNCTLTSDAFTATVAAWQTIELPSFGAQTPAMTVSCDVPDHVQGTTVVEPVNLTKRYYQDQAAGHALIGFGLIGMAVTAANASGRNKDADLIGYPAKVKITL